MAKLQALILDFNDNCHIVEIIIKYVTLLTITLDQLENIRPITMLWWYMNSGN